MDQSKHPQNILVPWDELEPDTLRNFVQDWIGREDGTYYGWLRPEMTMDEKIDAVIDQLKSGDAEIQWNVALESGRIVRNDQSNLPFLG